VDGDGRLAPLRRACSTLDVPVLLSCDPDRLPEAAEVTRAHGLAGVQVRGDPDAQALGRARRLFPDAIVGRSCHGLPAGNAAPVDYSCFAPVFAPRTPTPDRLKEPAGLEILRRWTADPQAWIVALGGIDPSRGRACLEAGARGLAGISLFFGAREQLAQDVAALVRVLRTV
jgi:thiamine-phosphate pyrophosphorylase